MNENNDVFPAVCKLNQYKVKFYQVQWINCKHLFILFIRLMTLINEYMPNFQHNEDQNVGIDVLRGSNEVVLGLHV